MVKAKAFFLVCAGILMLALAFELGAQSALSQVGLVTVADMNQGGGAADFTALVGRTVFVGTNNGGTSYQISQPIPGSSAVVSVGKDGGYVGAVLANGDFYELTQIPGGEWLLLGNVMAGATPVTQESWGATKVKYRN